MVYRELTLCIIVGLITQVTHTLPITTLDSIEDITQASHRYIGSHIVREHHKSVALIEDCNFHGGGRDGLLTPEGHIMVIGVMPCTNPNAYIIAIGACEAEQTVAWVEECLFHAPILAPYPLIQHLMSENLYDLTPC